MDDVLRIEGLSVSYYERERTTSAVDNVDLALAPGRVVAIVGESGCGKTTLALSILDLVPAPGRIDSGRVILDGEDLRIVTAERMRAIRGERIAMIFQDPVNGLNPVLSIGDQVAEILQAHHPMKKKEARRQAVEALRRQGLSEPERVAASYPFQLSGGMCQRVMIATATMLRPSVLIADEPTSALDVTLQAALLRELDDLRHATGMAIILITHDLGVVATIADEVAVMYAGRIIEHGSTLDVYALPQHPYTAALLAARARLDEPDRRLQSIRGAPPDLSTLTGECAFLPRCPKAITACRTETWPPLTERAPNHNVACYNPMYYA